MFNGKLNKPGDRFKAMHKFNRNAIYLFYFYQRLVLPGSKFKLHFCLKKM